VVETSYENNPRSKEVLRNSSEFFEQKGLLVLETDHSSSLPSVVQHENIVVVSNVNDVSIDLDSSKSDALQLKASIPISPDVGVISSSSTYSDERSHLPPAAHESVSFGSTIEIDQTIVNTLDDINSMPLKSKNAEYFKKMREVFYVFFPNFIVETKFLKLSLYY
jgi:hypothetical protein